MLPLSVARERHPELVEPHLGRVVAADDVFTRWNEDAWDGGAFVWVPRNVRVEAPILLTAVTAAAGTALQRRVLIVLEEGAEAEVWEQYLSGDDESETLLNTVVELVVGQNARLRYVCGQDLNEKSWIFGAQRAEVARDGSLDWVVRRLRRRQRARAHGDAAGRRRRAGQGHRRLRAARPPARRLRHHAGARRAEHDVRPRVPRHPRRPLAGGLARDDQGRPAAPSRPTPSRSAATSCSPSARTRTRSRGCEILANDVRCTHAAAIAQIDKEQLFYLRARGLGEPVAQRLVIEGFMQELVERFEEGPIREAMAGALERRLSRILD